jgi:solute:Na+ symporter, SSS family
MSFTDWIVLIFTLLFIIGYGIYKSRGQHGAETYLLADRKLPWYIVLLGVMATQASAITFISAPGQAYSDGMRFVQYYFGLPLAMIVICIVFIPIYQKLNVYTAYEYLEKRFDRKTRLLTASLFLLSRGLSTGISIYAPSIILSSILGWNIYLTNLITGGLLIIYSFTGGAKAIAHTQKLQFIIILFSIGIAAYFLIDALPRGVSFSDAMVVAGKSGKLNVITTEFSWKDKYNIWSGIIGGFFLALSYFGTDNSQVGRYISAKDHHESRTGLLLNGLVKVPMQFGILLIGAVLFSFFSFYMAPINFNESALTKLREKQPEITNQLLKDYSVLHSEYQAQAMSLASTHTPRSSTVDSFLHSQNELNILRDSVQRMISRDVSKADSNDTNYIFLYFVKNHLPRGLVGLLFAVIFLASWGSISAALNSLAASSLMDVQLLAHKIPPSEKTQLLLGRMHTLFWGLFSIGVAMFATQMGSLIEAVNVLGSLFYGTILGIFLVGFFIKKVPGTTVFISAIITEIAICLIYRADIVSFLWLNVIGVALLILLSLIINLSSKRTY